MQQHAFNRLLRGPRMQDDVPYTALEILSFIFGVSSIAGLTRLLKSNKQLTTRAVLSAMLSTGLYSLGMAFVLWKTMDADRELMTGLAILSGIGSQTAVEFIWTVIRNIIITQTGAPKHD